MSCPAPETIADQTVGGWCRRRLDLHTPVVSTLNSLPLPPTSPCSCLSRRRTIPRSVPRDSRLRRRLHFRPRRLQRLEQRGVVMARVTLHVGAGNSMTVSATRVEDHTVHRECDAVPESAALAVAAPRNTAGRWRPWVPQWCGPRNGVGRSHYAQWARLHGAVHLLPDAASGFRVVDSSTSCRRFVLVMGVTASLRFQA